jgi:hypothetical protein
MQGGGAPEEALPDAREVAQLLARMAANNHTICDDELRPLGIGLFPLGALLNHSSAPSCMQAFRGREVLFRWAARGPACPRALRSPRCWVGVGVGGGAPAALTLPAAVAPLLPAGPSGRWARARS